MRLLRALILILICSFIFVQDSSAQFLMENNYSAFRKQNRMNKEVGHYNMADGANCLMWIKTFNVGGLMTSYLDHNECGQSYARYYFQYDNKGKLQSYTMAFAAQNFKKITLTAEYNDKGQLISTKPDNPQAAGFDEEVYEYSQFGKMSKLTRNKMSGGVPTKVYEKTFDPKDSSFAQSEEKVNDDTGALKWTVIREWSFY